MSGDLLGAAGVEILQSRAFPFAASGKRVFAVLIPQTHISPMIHARTHFLDITSVTEIRSQHNRGQLLREFANKSKEVLER